MEEYNMKACPICGQMIMKTAKKCRFCGEWLKENCEPNAIFACCKLVFYVLIVIGALLFYADGFGIVLAIVSYIIAAIYFIPTIVADENRHPNTTFIFIINLFLGGTLLGWVVALIWALNKK